MGIYISVESPALAPKGYECLFKLSCYPTAILPKSDVEIELKGMRDWVEWLTRALMSCLADPRPFIEDGIGSPAEIVDDIKMVVDTIVKIGSQPHTLSWG